MSTLNNWLMPAAHHRIRTRQIDTRLFGGRLLVALLAAGLTFGCTRPASQAPAGIPYGTSIPKATTFATALPQPSVPPSSSPQRNETAPPGAATRTPLQATSTLPRPAAGSITIERVQVSQGQGIYVSGQSTLPQGACIQTELLAGGKPAGWWPGQVCVEPDETGRWEVLAAFGKNGAPDQLVAGTSYEVRAWWPQKAAETNTRFPFDLDGPPSPP